MTINGIIDGLAISDYIRDPARQPSLSASLAHLLLTRSPRHAWMASARLNPAWEPDESEARQDLGTIVHAILLEGDRSRIVVIDAEDYRTKDAKAKRDEAHLTGKLPILSARMVEVDAAVEAARAQLAASEIADAFTGGHAERTLIWTDPGGVTWRARPDWMDDDGRMLVDLKTTGGSAEPEAWSRGPLLAHGSDLQAVLALRGMTALCGHAERSFIFAVLEMAPPYGLSLIGLDPQFHEFANAKLDAAAKAWAACLATNTWSGYPSRVCWASPPSYAVYAFGERAERDHGEGDVSEL